MKLQLCSPFFVRVLSLLILILFFSALLPIEDADAKLAQNARRAVVLEAFHALRQSHDGGCDYRFPEYGQPCVSSWNYLSNDTPAYEAVRQWYACDSSVWVKSGDSVMVSNGKGGYNQISCLTPRNPYSFYSDVYAYGFNRYNAITKKWYDPSYGRGGQCKFFANLILYRSGTHTARLPSYGDMEKNSFKLDSNSNLSKVKEGDVIFATNVHTAIVVGIVRSGSNVVSIDVIDSNFVGGNGNEVIGRHTFIPNQLKSYRVWKGASYYSTNYDPNSR